MTLTPEQIETYSRQLILSDWSAETQQKICNTTISVPKDCKLLRAYLTALGTRIVDSNSDADIGVSWNTGEEISAVTLHAAVEDGELRVRLLDKQFSTSTEAPCSFELAQAAAAGMLAEYLVK